jgi:type II secretory pathway component GspD/PulD (secretin)
MRHLLLAGLLFLTSSASSSALGAGAQQLQPRNREAITIKFVNTAFEDVIGFLTRYAGIAVEFDDSATSERRNTKLTVSMSDVTLEEALDTLTRLSGLTYKVVDAQTILIYELP